MSGNWSRAVRATGTLGAALAISMSSAAVASAHRAKAHRAHKGGAPALKVARVSIKVGGKTVKKPVLVDGAGRPVYLLVGDSTHHPKCASSKCLAVWPAVTTKAKKVVAPGVSGRVALWNHKHMRQLELNGHPLYTYAPDSRGVATGDGVKQFGGSWWLLSKSGGAVKVAAAKKKTSGGGSGSGSGGGSGSSWG